MIKPLILVAALAIPASGGSLKDSPSTGNDRRTMSAEEFWQRLEEPPIIQRPIGVMLPVKAPYLRVEGIGFPFRVTPAVLNKYKLRVGQTVSRDLARHIMRDLGVDYPDATIKRLEQLDRSAPPEGADRVE